jgi:hypothetical protein
MRWFIADTIVSTLGQVTFDIKSNTIFVFDIGLSLSCTRKAFGIDRDS